MGVEYVEGGDRVFELVTTPDTPGYIRRELKVRVVSGPPLSNEEWARISAAWVAELVSAGNDVIEWEGLADDRA